MFNPEQFLDMSVTEANDTKVIPVPVGEYVALISDVKCRQWTAKDDPSKTGLTLDLMWEIDNQEVKELLGRDKVTVKQGIMLDITESGGLDMGRGRNASLGKLREALNLNTPGMPFSFSMLAGRVAKVSVSHRFDKNDPTVIYPEVKGVTKLN